MSAINSKPDVAMSSPSSEVDDQHAMKKEHSEDSPHYDTFDADTVTAKSDGRVKNPLHGIPKDRLLSDVDAFVSEKGLDEHRDVIRRGALVAQNPAAYETISELSQEEVAALDRERRHKWHQPLQLYLTIFAASLGSSVQGWDQTGSNGANLSFPQEFGIPTDKSVPNHEAHEWIVGLVNAAPYIASALCGCWLSDPINQLVGRRGTIFITAIILIITPICSGLTQTWPQLFVCRLLLGIGMGAKGSTVPVYAAENAPSAIRGALVMSWQMWTAFGIFLGFAANVIVKDVGPTAWRLQLGSAFIPAVPLAIMIYMCPESPRWLMKKNRYPNAFKSLLRLRNTPLEAARDLYYIHVLLEEEKKIYSGDSYFRRIKELFTIPRTRRATIASGTVMLAQQMCGINIIAFYSSTIFFEATNSVDQSLYASLGFGAVNFLFAIPALFTIDTFGRRSLLLFAFPSMAWSLLGAGLCFLMPTTNAAGDPNTARLALISLFIFIFAAFYSTSEGPVPFTYSAEVFDSAHREVGMGWAVTVCLGFAAILSITFFRLLIVLGVTGAFGFYAGLNVMALVLIFLFVPETKQLSLEELDAVFSVPHSTFISYQTKKVIPHFVQRWVLFNRSHKLEPLIRVDESWSKKTEQSQA